MQTNPRYQIIPGTYGTPTPNVTPAPGPPRPEPLPEMKPVQIDEGPPLPFNGRAFQIPNWGRLSDPQRVALLRRIVMNYGRDPRLRYFVDHRILRPAAVQNREYERQAAAILKWVQDNIRYLNEPGELLQSPWYTLQIGSSDCDDMAILLAAMFESIKLPWRFALSGVEKRHKNDRRPAKHVRWVEGEKFPRNVRWAHIYVRVGNRPFTPDKWHSAEPTIQGVPLGYDVVESRGNLPELGAVKEGEIAVINKSWAARLFADIKPEDIGKALILGAVGAAVGVGVRKVLK